MSDTWYMIAAYESDDKTVEAIRISQNMILPIGPKFSVDEYSSKEDARQAADKLWATRQESEEIS